MKLRIVSLLCTTAVSSFLSLRLAGGHPLCYYDERQPVVGYEETFCTDDSDEGFCCNEEEEQALNTTWASEATGLSDECMELHKEILCTVCDPYSAHIYEQEWGVTLTHDKCAEYEAACGDFLDSDYCDIHTGDSSGASVDGEDLFWSYPINDSEVTVSESLTKAFPDLNSTSLPEKITALHMTPDGSTWWVSGQDGLIMEFPATDPTTATEIIDIGSGYGLITGAFEEGLMDFAFCPSFDTNNQFYVSITIYDSNRDRYNRISRFTYDTTTGTADNEYIVLTTEAKNTTIHSAGWLGFKPSDYLNPGSAHDLYWTTGDGGPQEDTLNQGQNTDTLLSAMIRITVSATAGVDGYSIPSDNPFADGGGAPEICAWGLRNAYRCSFDSVDDTLYCGDVGYTRVEEIDVITCGLNYGWAQFEGSRCSDYDTSESCTNIDRTQYEFPIFEYCHSSYSSSTDSEEQTGGIDICGDKDPNGLAVIAGYVYYGNLVSDLFEGDLIWADYQKARLYRLRNTDGVWDSTLILEDGMVKVAGFAQDNDGEVYIIEYDGEIWSLPCGELCDLNPGTVAPSSSPVDEGTCLPQSDTVPAYSAVSDPNCYEDVIDDRALTLQQAPTCSTSSRDMNPDICASYCATIDGAFYFGVEYSYECFCGMASDDYDKHGTSTSCTAACNNYANETCGGNYAINVYSFGDTTSTPSPQISTSAPSTATPPMASTTPAPIIPTTPATTLSTSPVGTPAPVSPTSDEVTLAPVTLTPSPTAVPTPTTCLAQSESPVTFEAVTSPDNCFADDGTDRALTLEKSGYCSTDTRAMSPEICAAFCATIEGASYFGVEYSYECFCGSADDVYDKHGTSTECTRTCNSYPDEICGGNYAINVYSMTVG